jgi:uncharacterized Zn-finger protein
MNKKTIILHACFLIIALMHHNQLYTMKLHECGTCPAAFSSRAALMQHIRIHTGETPFTCEPCNKKFNQKSSYNRHILSKDHLYNTIDDQPINHTTKLLTTNNISMTKKCTCLLCSHQRSIKNKK